MTGRPGGQSLLTVDRTNQQGIPADLPRKKRNRKERNEERNNQSQKPSLGGGSWLLLPLDKSRTYFTHRTAPAKGRVFSTLGQEKSCLKKSLPGKFLVVVALQTPPLVVGMPFPSWKSPLVSVAPYSLKVTAEHYLILMGLTAFSPAIVQGSGPFPLGTIIVQHKAP